MKFDIFVKDRIKNRLWICPISPTYPQAEGGGGWTYSSSKIFGYNSCTKGIFVIVSSKFHDNKSYSFPIVLWYY